MNKKSSKIFLFILLSLFLLGFTSKLEAQETPTDTKIYASKRNVDVEDEVSIKLLINSNSKIINDFNTQIQLGEGLEYVDDSINILNVSNGVKPANHKFLVQRENSSINISSSEVRSQTYMIEFNVEITEDKESYQLTVDTTYNNQRTDTNTLNMNKKDQLINESRIKIINKSSDNTPIKGSRFSIYQEDELIEKVTTDENGIAKTSELPPGTYVVKQESIPNKYSHNFEEKTVTITDDTAKEISVEYENQEAGGQFKIQTLDHKKKGIPYEHITITDENGNSKQYETDENGIIETEKLPIGSYTIEYLEGNQSKNASILSDGKTKKVTFNRYVSYGKVKVYAKNTSGEPIAEHHYTLKDDEGNVIDELYTDENGYAESKTIEYGDYTLVDSETNQEINFTVEKGTVNVKITYGSPESSTPNTNQEEVKEKDNGNKENQPNTEEDEDDKPQEEVVTYEIESTSNTKIILIILATIVIVVIGILVIRRVLLGKPNN